MDLVWRQLESPLAGSLALSALAAALPVAVLGALMAWRRWKSAPAVAVALVAALALCLGVWGAPPAVLGGALLHGALYGLLPIGVIVFAAVLLFNLVVDSGRFAQVKASLVALSPELPVQVLVVAYAFGALLEGAAGFGTPVAICAAILAGLGLPPVRAAVVALLANTAPVAYGGLGIPVLVGAQVGGVEVAPATAAVALLLPVLSLASPVAAVAAACGWRATLRAWPVVVPAALVYTGLQCATALLAGPALPNVVAGLGTFALLVAAARLRRAPGAAAMPAPLALLRSWGPFWLLTALVVLWGQKPVKAWLAGLARWTLEIPGLHQAVARPGGEVLKAVYEFAPLATPGTAILIAALLSLPLLGMAPAAAWATARRTARALVLPLLAVALMLAFAWVMNYGGPAATLGACLAATGGAYPWIAPVLGWIGVFLTGSDTSSNAIFGGMQSSAAGSLDLPPAFGIGANTAGGGVGKMISPQSIAIATGAVDAKGRDADILRATVGWSLGLLALVCAAAAALAALAAGITLLR
ncbi:MAG: lactate permease LctP family transporter [Planctomycetes bacterium]|nr:lactate permease LctP family transporter [Planctomycetota bacterium]